MKSELYWHPGSDSHQASFLLRHQAPALVGRIPRLRMNSVHAAFRLKPPKLNLAKALAPKAPGQSVAAALPTIPKYGLPQAGPPGTAKPPGPSPLSRPAPLSAKLPKLPPLP